MKWRVSFHLPFFSVKVGKMDSKHLTREIFRIALPAITGFLSILFFDLADIFWISKLGTDAVAGVAASGFLEFAVYSLMGFTSVGCCALIAQARGEKDQKKAYQVAREAIHLTLVFSIILTIFLTVTGPHLLRWMGLSDSAFDAGLSYYHVFAKGIVVFYFYQLLGQVFYAHGDTKTAVLTLAAAFLLNAILDPLLIFGIWIFPKLGVQGAALGTLISLLAGVALRLYLLRKKKYIDRLKTFTERSSYYFSDILRIGVPTSTARLIWALVYPLLTSLVTRFGMAPLAGLTIAHRIEAFGYFTAYGFCVAMTTLVGHAVGKRDFSLARSIAYRGRWLVSCVLLPLTCIFVIAPHYLVRLASDDPEVIRQGVAYLRSVGLLEIFLGWEMVFEGSFNGIGNTRPYMLISVPLTFGRYPLAYFLVEHLGFGVTSIWWSIAISTTLKGVAMSFLFRRTSPCPARRAAPELGLTPPEISLHKEDVVE